MVNDYRVLSEAACYRIRRDKYNRNSVASMAFPISQCITSGVHMKAGFSKSAMATRSQIGKSSGGLLNTNPCSLAVAIKSRLIRLSMANRVRAGLQIQFIKTVASAG